MCPPKADQLAQANRVEQVDQVDQVGPRSRSWIHTYSVKPFVSLIRLYQRYISPLKPAVCRFTPTCSQYALEAYQHFGVFGGTWRTLNRLLRCHPWHAGGYDPVIPYEKKNQKT